MGFDVEGGKRVVVNNDEAPTAVVVFVVWMDRWDVYIYMSLCF